MPLFGFGQPQPARRGGSRAGRPNKPASERLALAQLREQRKRERELREWQLDDPEGYRQYVQEQRKQMLSGLTGGKPGALDTETVERVIRYLNTIGMEVVPKGRGKGRRDDDDGTLGEVLEVVKMFMGGSGAAVFGQVQQQAAQQPQPTPQPQAQPSQPQLPPAAQQQPAPPPAPDPSRFAPVPPDVAQRLAAEGPSLIGDVIVSGVAGKTPTDAAAWLIEQAGTAGSTGDLVRQFLPKALNTPAMLLPQLLGIVGKQAGWEALAAYGQAQPDLLRALIGEVRSLQQAHTPSL